MPESTTPSTATSPSASRDGAAIPSAVTEYPLTARIPRWAPGAVGAVLLVAAAVVGGTSGWILFGVALLVLGWLLAISWPHLALPGRMLQLAVVVAACAIVIVRLSPRA